MGGSRLCFLLCTPAVWSQIEHGPFSAGQSLSFLFSCFVKALYICKSHSLYRAWLLVSSFLGHAPVSPSLLTFADSTLAEALQEAAALLLCPWPVCLNWLLICLILPRATAHCSYSRSLHFCQSQDSRCLLTLENIFAILLLRVSQTCIFSHFSRHMPLSCYWFFFLSQRTGFYIYLCWTIFVSSSLWLNFLI